MSYGTECVYKRERGREREREERERETESTYNNEKLFLCATVWTNFNKLWEEASLSEGGQFKLVEMKSQALLKIELHVMENNWAKFNQTWHKPWPLLDNRGSYVSELNGEI